ncbi:MAG: cysteine desulfurase NifS [Candidatus Syntropharchaeia archaeon]
MRKIYFDHAATTPLDPEVFEAMKPYFMEIFGNPSSIHSFGNFARSAVEDSRYEIGKALGVTEGKIIFTSGGTESNNLAIKGVSSKRKDKNHVITSSIEHHAVLHPCEYLEEIGFDVTYLPVDEHGLIDLGDLEDAITEKTCLISIMHANNEIGTIEPIKEIGKIAREKGVLFHTDAVQSVGKIRIDVDEMNVDLLSLSGHKLYGPKGIGALYVRDVKEIDPIIHGGGHEYGLRSGTENVPGIVGLSKAIEISMERMDEENERLSFLQQKLVEGVLEIEGSILNGHPEKRLPGYANFCFRGINGEALLSHLNSMGIAASSGSACSSKSMEPSHVLLAIGRTPEEAHGSLRITLGRENTNEEVDYFLEILPEIVKNLRKISAL